VGPLQTTDTPIFINFIAAIAVIVGISTAARSSNLQVAVLQRY